MPLDQFPDAMIAVARDGTIRYWSRGAEATFGYGRQEAIGRPLGELIGGGLLGDAAWPAPGATARFQTTRRRKDGGAVTVDASVRTVPAADGPAYLAMSLREVTTALAPLAALGDLLDAAPDAMLLVDDAGRIAVANREAERLFGYAGDALVGVAIEDLVPARLRAAHVGHRVAYAAAPRTRLMGRSAELFARHRDGREVPIEVSLSPVLVPSGLYTCAAVRDVSARRATEAALRFAYQELEAFSYSVAHDLRAPLRAMDGFASILLDEHAAELGADGAACAREIQDAARRMRALVDALLELSRITRAELVRVRVDLAELAAETVARLAAAEPDRAVAVAITPELHARVDPNLARTLLDNLLGNAWKFTRGAPAPHIAVGATEVDGRRAFFVRDDGAGFDPASAHRLFAPFQRLHRADEFPGTGIGLATAQRIVRRHGGTIWAEAAPGRGATFYFTLPDPEAAP